MASLSLRIYLTANILVAAIVLFIDTSFIVAITASAMVFAFSILFSIPAGFAIYYTFRLIDAVTENIWLRWILFHVCLFLVAFIPYLFVSAVLAGDLASNDLLIVLYFSEGSAFVASLFNCIAIHRFFKNSSHENN